MAILRRAYHLEEYVTEKHFVYLGYLMAAFAAIMLYANISELLTQGYKLAEGVEFHFRQIFLADFAPFALLIPVFVKVFPIIAVWEVAEDHEAMVGAPGTARPAALETQKVAGG